MNLLSQADLLQPGFEAQLGTCALCSAAHLLVLLLPAGTQVGSQADLPQRAPRSAGSHRARLLPLLDAGQAGPGLSTAAGLYPAAHRSQEVPAAGERLQHHPLFPIARVRQQAWTAYGTQGLPAAHECSSWDLPCCSEPNVQTWRFSNFLLHQGASGMPAGLNPPRHSATVNELSSLQIQVGITPLQPAPHRGHPDMVEVLGASCR